jgi:micrococcal nuclease|tara:strand:- start:7022 stop:7456 length:435 start_codon:yes stop_codon:yes gene_type:complete
MYEYNSVIRKIVDGDTIDVDIDLGFGVWLKDQRIRLHGIDTPECRTRDAEEKIFGLAAKNFVISSLPVGSNQILKTVINKDGEDVRGKFGRILGDFTLTDNATLVETMIGKGYGVEYKGQSKDLIEQAHLAARKRLISAGIVTI